MPLVPPTILRLPLLIEILARFGVRGNWKVEARGLSVGADRVLPRRVGVFTSVRSTLLQDPAGLKRVGASLLLELLFPRFWLLGGLPRGARTGERDGSFPDPALLERVGETTAAAAAISERPDVPCRSTLFIRELGGRAYV